MRKLLFLFVFFVVVSFRNDGDKEVYIEIHDNQYGCHQSREYYLEDSTLSINDYNEEGEIHDSKYKSKIVLNRRISLAEIKKEKDFMIRFPWDSLRAEYSSGRDGCDSIRQIAITIRYNGIKKEIVIQDCYSEKAARIFRLINSLIPQSKANLKISYRAESFKCRQ